jgi:hypothetical protein
MGGVTRPRRGLDGAFGGKRTTLDEQREIWQEALHEDAIWEGPTFETPIYMVGRTVIIESTGGGPTIHGGRYQQRYFSRITTRDGQAFRMREYCNPFQTYKAFGREFWDRRIGEIMERYNVDWPASQAPDPARLPDG